MNEIFVHEFFMFPSSSAPGLDDKRKEKRNHETEDQIVTKKAFDMFLRLNFKEKHK